MGPDAVVPVLALELENKFDALDKQIELQSTQLIKMAEAANQLLLVVEMHPTILRLEKLPLSAFIEQSLERMAAAATALKASLPK